LTKGYRDYGGFILGCCTSLVAHFYGIDLSLLLLLLLPLLLLLLSLLLLLFQPPCRSAFRLSRRPCWCWCTDHQR